MEVTAAERTTIYTNISPLAQRVNNLHPDAALKHRGGRQGHRLQPHHRLPVSHGQV
jgi:hypothetical protein